MKHTLAFTIALFVVSISYSQHNKASNSRIKYGSIFQAGLISGNKGESYLVQTINGIKKDKWFTGVGVGLDFYNERGVPVSIDVRRDVLNNKNSPFIYANGGLNFEWLNFIQHEERNFPKVLPGLYYDIGAGWKLGGRNNRGFIISAGYSFKQSKERSNIQLYNPVTQMNESSFQRIDYKYNRIVLKIGFQL